MKKKIIEAYEALKTARLGGDSLTIDLAQASLNDLLDQYVTLATCNEGT